MATVRFKGWIGVDLDRTLAHYDTWKGPAHIGAPIPLMLERVQKWVAEGQEVRIVTARVYSDGSPGRNLESQVARNCIRQWTKEHVGMALSITCEKDFDMLEIWDDRAVQIIPNTGVRADGQP